ncbi:FecR family protein [Aureibacter tunicatorum]|uniref:Ferric-dicitrate binding protein FerR (Iron transport regulator) n=1 Tax=Aureibacter tunicatorum TaxID=866807 RepID=A0AAE3XML9_9BACT|nr:FecR domain-containing protein [Aureibacter tunicatorum]MDR6238763.1 ferric-dicitrate binding protein FerR (iron transport regulator) [Aureibacter tunicatorum]BDD05306.1 hypothetical protein AUTU_27890 [Aureibacter tunicatorum]
MEDKDYLLLMEFARGSLTSEERQKVEERLLEEEELRETLSIIMEMENQSDMLNVPKFNLATGRSKLAEKMYEMEKVAESTELSKIVEQETNSRPIRMNRRWIAVAASFALLLMASIGGYLQYSQEEKLWNTIAVELGEKREVILEDGSKVVLNSGSKLKYPLAFNKGHREVYLEGEAFFDVESDSTRPFLVHTAHVVGRVLGTSFNIRAFGDEKTFKASLVSGRLNLEYGKEKPVILKPEEEYVLDIDKSSFEVRNFKAKEVCQWKDNVLLFSHKSVHEVFAELERWYGVEVIGARQFDRSMTINASFKNESVDQVMEGLAFVLDFEYEIEDGYVRIQKGTLEK